MLLHNRLRECDEGRFSSLIDAMVVIDVCIKCAYFNQQLSKSSDNLYRCKVSPNCIAATLSVELISYLLWQIGEKTEQEHMSFLGL